MFRRMMVAACAVVLVGLAPGTAPAKHAPGCTSHACDVRVTAKRREACDSRACKRRTCSTAVCHGRVREKRWRRLQRDIPSWLKATLKRLRYCESRGNYRATNGSHWGAYQYDDATWHEAGGRGRAWDASPAEQDVRTARFYPTHRGRWACRA